MAGFFGDLFSSLTPKPISAPKPKASVPASTYASQVPKQASQPAPKPYVAPSTFKPGGSTYESQVPKAASPWASSGSAWNDVGQTGSAISLGATGQTTSGVPSSGGGSSGGGSGGGGVSPPPATPAPPPPPPPPPAPVQPKAEMPDMAEWEVLTIPDAQSNAQYVAQMASLKNILDNYMRQDKSARDDKLAGTNLSLKDLGWIDPDGYEGAEKGSWDERGQGSFGRSYVANENDFAGRGMTQSGFYKEAQSNLAQEYNDRLNALNTEQSNWTNAQDIKLQSAKDEKSTKEAEVKANTVADIAASLGVDADMVLSGFGTGTGQRYKRRVDSGAKDKEREYAKTGAKSASQLNKASKTDAEARRKAAQVLLDEKYRKEMEKYMKQYG